MYLLQEFSIFKLIITFCIKIHVKCYPICTSCIIKHFKHFIKRKGEMKNVFIVEAYIILNIKCKEGIKYLLNFHYILLLSDNKMLYYFYFAY